LAIADTLGEPAAGPPARGAAPARTRGGSPLRLRALMKTREVTEKILAAMHLSAEVPELHPARPPPVTDRAARDADNLIN
jgi:hypothetical protein